MIHNSSAPAMHGASSRLRGFSDQALAMGQCAPYFYCGSSFAHEVRRLGLMVSAVGFGGLFRRNFQVDGWVSLIKTTETTAWSRFINGVGPAIVDVCDCEMLLCLFFGVVDHVVPSVCRICFCKLRFCYLLLTYYRTMEVPTCRSRETCGTAWIGSLWPDTLREEPRWRFSHGFEAAAGGRPRTLQSGGCDFRPAACFRIRLADFTFGEVRQKLGKNHQKPGERHRKHGSLSLPQNLVMDFSQRWSDAQSEPLRSIRNGPEAWKHAFSTSAGRLSWWKNSETSRTTSDSETMSSYSWETR